MRLNYNEDYTNAFHSPGIEPWITGFLRGKSPKTLVDVGCGLGFTALLLRLYLCYGGYLVGLDVLADKVSKAKKLGLYDDLVVGDAKKPPFKSEVFDTFISLEVLHDLPGEVLTSNEEIVKENGCIMLVLPYLPKGITVKDLISRDYDLYRCFLRGLILVNLRSYKVLLARNSTFFKVISALLAFLTPLFRLTSFFKDGYLLALK